MHEESMGNIYFKMWFISDLKIVDTFTLSTFKRTIASLHIVAIYNKLHELFTNKKTSTAK